MADDPWSQFVPPSSSAGAGDDPWSQFVAPSAPTRPQTSGGGWFTGGDQPEWLNQNAAPSLGQMSVLEKPADVSYRDFALAHLAEWAKGGGQIGQAADDYVRSATNAFGVGDRFAAYMSGLTGVGGGDLAAQKTQTAAANERLPPEARIAANVTGYGPFASLGIAGRLGGGVMGTAAEGAAAGGAAELGQGGSWPDLVTGTLGGGALGGVGGAATKYVVNPIARGVANAAGRATLSDPAAVTAGLKADRDGKYEALKNVFYHPLDVQLNALDPISGDIALNDPAGELTANAPRSMAALGSLQNLTTTNQTQTAHSIVTTLDKLRDIKGPAAGAENDVAPIIENRLNNFLASAPPVNQSDYAPGAAAGMVKAAKDAHQVYSNARDLQQWGQSLKGFGSSPAGPAQRTAETYYNNRNDPRYKALANIAQSAGGSGQTAYNLMHMIDPILGYVGASMGGGPGAIAGEIGGHMLKPGLASALTGAQQRGTQRAIAAAYPALTGKPPTAYSPDFGQAVRSLLLGNAAASGY